MKALRYFANEKGGLMLQDGVGEELGQLQWLIKLRWWAPVIIAAVAGICFWAEGDKGFAKLLIVSGFVLGYNLLLYRWILRFKVASVEITPALRRSVCYQAALDGTTVLLLVALTGGIGSPLCFLLVLPVILVATLLTQRSAYTFAAFVLAGITLVAIIDRAGWLSHKFIALQSAPPDVPRDLYQFFLNMFVLYLMIAMISFLTVALAGVQRNKARKLQELLASATALNQKLWSLFSMIQTIGSAQNLNHVLEVVSSETAALMNVRGISVKLVSEDGKYLRYAAAYGLPETFVKEKVVEVYRSPLNKRIIQGESFVTGNVTVSEMFQFGEVLAEAQIKSVLFLPLRLEGKVIGILGAYCVLADRFTEEDVGFFSLVAQLVAITLENARAYEAVEKLVKERSWYMLRVAHNLRAPLAGMLSILDVVRGEYLGALNAEQQEYLRRLDRRSRTMLMMVNELMTLAKSREEKIAEPTKFAEPAMVARRIRRTFQDRAAEKNIAFSVVVAENLPSIRGELEMVEQILENLVSNAIKYTLSDGTVEVKLSQHNDMIRIEIRDTGIGIPAADRPRLFAEFFRAENARAVEKTGTGLGLAIVKEFVDKLAGRILVESEEGMGTIFVVDLPVATDFKGGHHDRSANP